MRVSTPTMPDGISRRAGYHYAGGTMTQGYDRDTADDVVLHDGVLVNEGLLRGGDEDERVPVKELRDLDHLRVKRHLLQGCSHGCSRGTPIASVARGLRCGAGLYAGIVLCHHPNWYRYSTMPPP